MEFLPPSRRRSSARNVPSGEERGETRGQTDVFAGYVQLGHVVFFKLASVVKAYSGTFTRREFV